VGAIVGAPEDCESATLGSLDLGDEGVACLVEG
jgi:hypothetical protein